MRWIRIFDNWEAACNRLPADDPYLLQIGDLRISIVRHDEQLFAFQALCPHQNEPLYKGKVNRAGEVICPLHAYRFNLNTGRECRERTEDMEIYPVKIDNGVFIGIN